MPTSAKVLPCSSFTSSGLYITEWVSCVKVLMIVALARARVGAAIAAIWPVRTLGSLISATSLVLAHDLAHHIRHHAPAQRLEIDRRWAVQVSIGRRTCGLRRGGLRRRPR